MVLSPRKPAMKRWDDPAGQTTICQFVQVFSVYSCLVTSHILADPMETGLQVPAIRQQSGMLFNYRGYRRSSVKVIYHSGWPFYAESMETDC